MKEPKVSVVIPNCIPNREVASLFDRMWASLWDSELIANMEIILVDNGIAIPHGKRCDVQIEIAEPIGYASAVNCGIRASSGDLIVVANNDIQLPRDWLSKMLIGHREGVTTATDVPGPDVQYNSAWGALWMIDRPMMEKVGLLDEDLNYRYMDQDYWIRVFEARGTVRRVNVVVSHEKESITVRALNQTEHFGKEEERMLKKHGVTLFSQYIRKLAQEGKTIEY